MHAPSRLQDEALQYMSTMGVRCVLHGSGKSPEQRETEGQDRGAELSIRSTGMQLMQVTVAPS